MTAATPWDAWHVEALQLGMDAAVADLGRSLLREAHQEYAVAVGICVRDDSLEDGGQFREGRWCFLLDPRDMLRAVDKPELARKAWRSFLDGFTRFKAGLSCAPATRQVTSCDDCPGLFLAVGARWPIYECLFTAPENDWHNGHEIPKVFLEDVHETMPDWCPLRAGPVLVSLHPDLSSALKKGPLAAAAMRDGAEAEHEAIRQVPTAVQP